MEAYSFSSFGASASLPPLPPPSSSSQNFRRLHLAGGTAAPAGRRVARGGAPARAWRREGYEGDFGGRLVDEDMIVLRRLLWEMEVEEKGSEAAPAHWAEWERSYYARYGADVCEMMGVLQRLLLNSRPAVALGIIAAVAVSVPTAAAAVVFNVVVAAISAGGLLLG